MLVIAKTLTIASMGSVTNIFDSCDKKLYRDALKGGGEYFLQN